MMTSVVADAARGNRDRVQPQTTHTTQPQKQIQATAEQIRLAQMIYDKNDADFEGKIKQLIEVTGRNQDECMVALHDCNGDVNRAINFLLEEVTVKDSWETVGKKKSVVKEVVPAENKEKRMDKEGRGRGGPNRRGRGATRIQEGRSDENGTDTALGERGGERGRRGRGRGAGSRGRGRGTGVNRFSQGMGTFNPAEYTGSGEVGEAVNDTTDAAGAWKNLDEWVEDWNEDLTETKVFTASFALAPENRISPGQGVDLSSLLPKAAEVDSELELASPEPLTQSLVFTNSQQQTSRTSTHSYASAAANSYASAAAGTYAHAASSLGSSRMPQPDFQKAEPINTPRFAPLPNQTPVALNNSNSAGDSSAPSPPAPAPMAVSEAKLEIPVTASHLDLKAQPDPSPILSQLTQHQNPTLQSDLLAQGRDPSPPLPSRNIPSPAPKPLGELSAPTMAEPSQPKHIRPQRRRLPPPSKIPASAVEMPGSADVSGLNVQFGALDFASEAAVDSPSQSEASSLENAPTCQQPQSSLYSKLSSTVSEPLGGLPPALSTAAVEPRYPSPSLGLPAVTATAPTLSRTEPSSLNKDTTTTSATSLTNGFEDVRPSSAQEAVPSSTPQSVSTTLPSENGLASATLPSSSSSAPAPAPTTALPSLSSHVSSGTTLGSAPSTSSSLGSQMASDVSGNSSAYSSGSVVSSVSSVVSSNGLSTGAPGLTTNGPSAPSTGRSAPLQNTTTAKAPPNLAQGVPPLLANQYIMGPGGLLPAYPIYGYEDLQMMQSRLPMDYYGMTTFPGTNPLAARDGGLANNPYSGEPNKFARGEAASPAPTTSLSSVVPSQAEQGTVPPQTQAPQNPGQAFLNPPLPPGYGYTSLPYYTGMPGMPSAFQYGPTVFMPQASAKQHGLGPSAQYQHQASYSQHAYASGFDDLSQAHAGADYGKGGYGGNAQSQAKPCNNTVKAPGLSGSANSDLSAAVYSKTQSFDKQGFPAATPPTFSLPSALGGTGPLNPGGAPGYAPAPFLHILPPHQQPPSQLLHHHMAQDTQGQRSQSSSMQKNQGKSSYSSSPYWAN